MSLPKVKHLAQPVKISGTILVRQTRMSDPVINDKKADVASWIALQTPKPPNLTRRKACIQVVSLFEKRILPGTDAITIIIILKQFWQK